MTQPQSNLCFLTILEAGKLLRQREISPVELTGAFLRRIEEVDNKLHAYIKVLPEEALAEARMAEAAILRGGYLGPLHGIPIALKDLYWTKGIPTTANSKILESWVPQEDATTVARLRTAGIILLGKLTMSEFATMSPDFTCPFPPARNPWNPAHVPGGSSSGSGAGVASGLCMGSLGSDTAGSIRRPASLSGIVGLKPTYGRVSRYGVVPLSWTMDHCGPMTWTVEDTAIMLPAIAGYDPKDSTTSRASVPDYSAALKEDVEGITIGVARDFLLSSRSNVNKEVTSGVEKAVETLEQLGAKILDVTIPSIAHSSIAGNVIWMSEAYSYHRNNIVTRPHDYGALARTLLRIGGLFTAGDYVQAQRVRSLLKRELAQVFQSVDLLVTPANATPAAAFDSYVPLDRMRGPSFFSLTSPFNLTGLPAISVPCGFTSSGLPMGMQLVGKPFDESTVLRAAHAYQQKARWFERRPPI